MDAADAALVKDSYIILASRMEPVAARFYERLFARHPPLRGLFRPDLTAQRAHLAAAVAMVARNADHLDALEGPLADMGARHLAYGARPEHYPIVRDTLLESLAHALGDEWTPRLADAWRRALSAVAAAMLKGAARAELDAVTARLTTHRKAHRA